MAVLDQKRLHKRLRKYKKSPKLRKDCAKDCTKTCTIMETPQKIAQNGLSYDVFIM